MGHTFNGIYSIVGAKFMETVFCDFCKTPSDPGFQTWIGFDDVKSSPTYFTVQRFQNFRQQDVPIPFDVELLNVGGAMNAQTGKFTAPRAGTYFFSFVGWAYFSPSTSQVNINVGLFLNGNSIGRGHADEMTNNLQIGDQYETFTLQSTLNLQAGNQIWLQMFGSSSGALLTGSYASSYVTTFTGLLLQEEISQSVKV
ncbi:C1q and tumor necrosis factor-related protein 2 [Daphnia pulex]|uniref:C1q and tumor necrosis factor-related protein 2 n=1 Tax=Daphnia pulex TaxID=6669 RepID=E9FZX9_DAPPU|nr:C1q and tumor necrosis factor-related protein 2 [Daphnia pulex]|eukprot:EFX87180.1 C1q and tumor necrosis factor-related protein 2 [Daphnia pulex]